MINNWALIILGLAAGSGLGFLYFGGLWYTTKRLVLPGGPRPFVLVSFLVRSIICLFGFYLVLRFTGFPGLLSGMAGFITMQVTFVRLISRKVN